MTRSADDALTEAARTYEGLFIPALIGEWAPRVADAAMLNAGERVLDVACGTGVLAREAAARVGSTGRVSGIDPGIGMLALARELAPMIEWREGVAEALPYPDRSFDAALCQFGLMFFTDRARALREMLRVLKPGGRMALAVWDRLESMPAYAEEVALFDREAGRPAGDALRGPFVLGDPVTRRPGLGRGRELGGRDNRVRHGAISQHPGDGGGRPARLATGNGCHARRGDHRPHTRPG